MGKSIFTRNGDTVTIEGDVRISEDIGRNGKPSGVFKLTAKKNRISAMQADTLVLKQGDTLVITESAGIEEPITVPTSPGFALMDIKLKNNQDDAVTLEGGSITVESGAVKAAVSPYALVQSTSFAKDKKTGKMQLTNELNGAVITLGEDTTLTIVNPKKPDQALVDQLSMGGFSAMDDFAQAQEEQRVKIIKTVNRLQEKNSEKPEPNFDNIDKFVAPRLAAFDAARKEANSPGHIPTASYLPDMRRRIAKAAVGQTPNNNLAGDLERSAFSARVQRPQKDAKGRELPDYMKKLTPAQQSELADAQLYLSLITGDQNHQKMLNERSKELPGRMQDFNNKLGEWTYQMNVIGHELKEAGLNNTQILKAATEPVEFRKVAPMEKKAIADISVDLSDARPAKPNPLDAALAGLNLPKFEMSSADVAGTLPTQLANAQPGKEKPDLPGKKAAVMAA